MDPRVQRAQPPEQRSVAERRLDSFLNCLSRGAADRLLRRGADHLTRVRTSHLHVTHGGDPVRFSLDGEMIETNELVADSDPGMMRFFVGPAYDPNPDASGTPASK